MTITRRITGAPGEIQQQHVFLELVERLLSCLDSLEPRGLSMTAYSAAKLLFGDQRCAGEFGIEGASWIF